MSHEQRYFARLQNQFQEAGSRILRLENTVAQKDDQLAQKECQLANANAQIQRLMSAPTANNGNQNMTAAMQTQINQANTRAITAENNLKVSVDRFNRVHGQQQMHIQQQQKQIQMLQKENERLKSSGGGVDRAKWDQMEKSYKGLQKQFDAHKKQDSRRGRFPATAKGKGVADYGADDDEDDEEPKCVSVSLTPRERCADKSSAPWVKKESLEKTADRPTTAASLNQVPQPPVPQMPAFNPVTDNNATAPRLPSFNTPMQQSPRQSPFRRPTQVPSIAASVSSTNSGVSMVPASPRAVQDYFSVQQQNRMATRPARQESTASHTELNQHFKVPMVPSDVQQQHQHAMNSPQPFNQQPVQSEVGMMQHRRSSVARNELPQIPQRIQQLPTPARSFGQESVASNMTIDHRPRANAVDISSSMSQSRPEKRRRQQSVQEEIREEVNEPQIKQEVQGLHIRDPTFRASLEKRNPDSKTRYGSERSSQAPVITISDTPSPAPSPAPPSKRARTSNDDAASPSPTNSHTSTYGENIRDKFDFKAITSYDGEPTDEASIEYLHSKHDLADVVPALWARIRKLHDLWEEARGELWIHEFKYKMKNQDSKQCVSSKLRIEGRETGRSKWHTGFEGVFACKQCVAENKPCFVWKDKEFFLLPLRDEDRFWPVEEGLEMRRWVDVK